MQLAGIARCRLLQLLQQLAARLLGAGVGDTSAFSFPQSPQSWSTLVLGTLDQRAARALVKLAFGRASV
jgi:hypothetical protein